MSAAALLDLGTSLHTHSVPRRPPVPPGYSLVLLDAGLLLLGDLVPGHDDTLAFEVEHSTPIYSGTLRMADLLALQPNMDIRPIACLSATTNPSGMPSISWSS